MTRALITAYQMKFNGDNTKNNCKSALGDFSKYLKEIGINDLRKVKKEHVLSYASDLNERFEEQTLSASTVQNYLSKVNVAMENARLDDSCRVCPVREADLPSRSGIATIDKSTDDISHTKALNFLSERLGAQLELQRQLGLRFKESTLIDAKETLQYAEMTGLIRIEYGTKGGLIREYPIVEQSQINALRDAARIQDKDRSIIPSNLSWVQYKNQCYREISKTNILFHGERHSYANRRFEELSGVKSPIQSGISHGNPHHKFMAKKLHISVVEARHLDYEVRFQIAKELGHGRVNVTNNYLG